MTDFSSFTAAVSHDFLGGLIGIFIMIIVFAVFFLSLLNKGYRASAAACVGCWATTMVTLLLRPMNLISDWQWWLGIALVPISILVMFIYREEAY